MICDWCTLIRRRCKIASETGPSRYAFDSVKLVSDGIEDNSDGRRFIWTVDGWAGTQRYAVMWTGDDSGSWDFIRWQIPTFVGAGFSAQVNAAPPCNTPCSTLLQQSLASNPLAAFPCKQYLASNPFSQPRHIVFAPFDTVFGPFRPQAGLFSV